MPLAVCATPIGNLADVTLRALEELRAADTILCEDTRHTRLLLARHGIEARLLSYHRHNEATRAAELLPRLREGERIALVSDAGLPGINDPGVRLVVAARAAGVEVTVLPGASAVETALVASGLAGEGYSFLGFLPRSGADRARLWTELVGRPYPTVGFESPRRLPALLASLAAVEPERLVAVCRELTKVHEEVVCDTAEVVAERFREAPRGEITVVIGAAAVGPPPSADADLAGAVAAVRRLVEAGAARRTAAGIVAELTGSSRKTLYDASL